MPKFSAIVAATPQVSMPTGAVLGTSLGSVLGTMSASYTNNKLQKKSLLGLADAMESQSPEAAQTFRVMADNIPAFSVPGFSGGGSSGGGGGGGLGNMTGMAMDTMMDLVKMNVAKANSIAVDNAATENTMLVDSIRHQNATELANLRFDRERTARNDVQDKAVELEKLKAKLEREPDPNKKEEIAAEISKKAIDLQISQNSLLKMEGENKAAADYNASQERQTLIRQAQSNYMADALAKQGKSANPADMSDDDVHLAAIKRGNVAVLNKVEEALRIKSDSKKSAAEKIKAERELLQYKQQFAVPTILVPGSNTGRLLNEIGPATAAPTPATTTAPAAKPWESSAWSPSP